MIVSRRTAIAMGAALLPALWLTPAQAAETTLNISLWDKGMGSMDMMGTGPLMGMAMMHGADMSKAMMGITTDATSVPAGTVTFRATNDSKDLIHEMVLSPIADVTKPMPYDSELRKVDEDAAGHLGEVAELEPGQSGALTIEMKPGTYILYCNIAGHYELGMWTLITVTG